MPEMPFINASGDALIVAQSITVMSMRPSISGK